MSDIFVPKNKAYVDMIKFEEIIKTIPKNSFKNEQLNLKHLTEWRWRILNIKNKKFIEISYNEPNADRLYLDKYNSFIKENIDPLYDKFVVDIFYYYT
jgi:hypothetical protein